MTKESRATVQSVETGWQLRVLSDDATHVDWLEVFLVLHTQRGEGLPNRVWIYLTDRSQPLIYDWDEVVHVRQT